MTISRGEGSSISADRLANGARTLYLQTFGDLLESKGLPTRDLSDIEDSHFEISFRYPLQSDNDTESAFQKLPNRIAVATTNIFADPNIPVYAIIFGQNIATIEFGPYENTHEWIEASEGGSYVRSDITINLATMTATHRTFDSKDPDSPQEHESEKLGNEIVRDLTKLLRQSMKNPISKELPLGIKPKAA